LADQQAASPENILITSEYISWYHGLSHGRRPWWISADRNWYIHIDNRQHGSSASLESMKYADPFSHAAPGEGRAGSHATPCRYAAFLRPTRPGLTTVEKTRKNEAKKGRAEFFTISKEKKNLSVPFAASGGSNTKPRETPSRLP
jgi:hypothetical protein